MPPNKRQRLSISDETNQNILKEVGHLKQKINEKQDTSPVSSLHQEILEKSI
jgi:hypothetical protein